MSDTTHDVKRLNKTDRSQKTELTSPSHYKLLYIATSNAHNSLRSNGTAATKLHAPCRHAVLPRLHLSALCGRRSQRFLLLVLPHLACVFDEGQADEDPVVQVLGGQGAVLGHFSVRDICVHKGTVDRVKNTPSTLISPLVPWFCYLLQFVQSYTVFKLF